jgi:hypothetical protein
VAPCRFWTLYFVGHQPTIAIAACAAATGAAWHACCAVLGKMLATTHGIELLSCLPKQLYSPAAAQCLLGFRPLAMYGDKVHKSGFGNQIVHKMLQLLQCVPP